MGSLTCDSGSSSSSVSPFDRESGLRSSLKRFSLMPIPPHAHRQGRKTSDTSSINTIKGDTTINTSSLEPARRMAFELFPSKHPGQRASSYLGVSSDVSLCDTSPNVPRIKESVSLSSHSSGNFLSRMWGAATKAQEKLDISSTINSKATTLGPPVISVVEPKEAYLHLQGASAFRRLVHSRSAVFRTGDV